MDGPDPKLQEELRGIFEKTRKEAVTFALLTVAITPFLLVLAGILLMTAMMVLGVEWLPDSEQGVLIFVSLFLFISLWSTWTHGDNQQTWIPLGLSVAVVILTATGPVGPMSLRVHLGLSGALAFCALALMGRAYEPDDNLGAGIGPQQIDHMNVAVGCATAIPALVLGAFGEVFASSWLWNGIDERVVSSGARVLVAAHRRTLDDVLPTIGHERHRVIDLLRRAQLVRIYRNKVTVTERGHALLER